MNESNNNINNISSTNINNISENKLIEEKSVYIEDNNVNNNNTNNKNDIIENYVERYKVNEVSERSKEILRRHQEKQRMIKENLEIAEQNRKKK